MTDKLHFFINGNLINKTNETNETNDKTEDKYIMRFLTESKDNSNVTINIKFFRNNEYIECVEYDINGLTLIEYDCDSIMVDSFDLLNPINKYFVKYIVYHEDKFLFNGSFSIIKKDYNGYLKFASVSCNANKKFNDNNDYNLSRSKYGSKLWSKLRETRPDIIFHCGDQIYGDYIYKKNIGYDKKSKKYDHKLIYDKYAQLYRTSYGENAQGDAMRNSLNIMILDDHEISDGFGTPKAFSFLRCKSQTKNNKHFHQYYKSGMRAYLNYQYQTMFNVDEILIKNALVGNISMSNKIAIGKYQIIMLDERYELYHKQCIFSDETLKWIDNTLKNSNKKETIIVSPRPIGHLNSVNALLQGIIISDGVDELLHHMHLKKTLKLLDILYKYKNDKKYILVSGDVHKTFINDITRKGDNEPFLKQITASGITVLPRDGLNPFVKFVHNIQQKLIFFNLPNYKISKRRKESNKNNFGLIISDKLDNYIL